MKKTFILFFVFIVMISAKDNPQIIRANYFEAKSGQSAKLQKGLKRSTGPNANVFRKKSGARRLDMQITGLIPPHHFYGPLS